MRNTQWKKIRIDNDKWIRNGSQIRLEQKPDLYTVYVYEEIGMIELLNSVTNKRYTAGQRNSSGWEWGGDLCHVKEVVEF